MTWLWRICFSVLGVLPALAATLTGSVRLVESADPGVRGRADFSGVVVWLEPLGGHPAAADASSAPRARMVQKDKRFIPHVLAIRTGAIVDFPNYDPIFHNAFSSFSGQIFDVGLYPPGSTRAVGFKRSGIVRVFCNIHPSMSAVIMVLDTPWFGVSAPSGAFEIRDLPPGEYRLRVFHERATGKTLDALERRVALNQQDLALAPISISETGYVETPHKNKYGADYSPAADDHVLYPGGHH
jgi:plastocyanin